MGDCVYFYQGHDGCQGGFSEDAWMMSKYTGSLSLTKDNPYTGTAQGGCGVKYETMHNGLIVERITGYHSIPAGEDNVINYLAKGAVGIAFEVTDDFFSYEKGVIEDTSCRYGDTGGGDWGAANHAVTGIGYTPNSIILKNSWGDDWGMQGFWETARGTDLCEYFRWGSVPTWEATGEIDHDPEYVPTDPEDCEGGGADGCVCGTVRCGDGVCRHAHMC